MKKRNWSGLANVIVVLMLVVHLAAACSKDGLESSTTHKGDKGGSSESAPKGLEGQEQIKLKLAMWDTKVDLDYWTEKVKEYNQSNASVKVEVEMVPDNNSQYLKIRLAAGDMPDIFFLKPSYFHIYKDALLPLDDLIVTAANKYPTRIDGKVLGLPLVSFSEFVYYHPSIFEELELEVPRTLSEWLSAMETIKGSSSYIPLSLGGKESWTFYPFLEFGPHVLSKKGNYLAELAATKAPFGPGSYFDRMANVIKVLSDEKYAGPDALSVSFYQATQQFESGKAAMIVLGQWYYSNYMSKVGTDKDLGVFPLPFEDEGEGKPYAMVMSDMNVGISKDSRHLEESKDFLSWMFSEDIYADYINKVQQLSTVEGIESELPFFNKWTNKYPFEPLYYEGTDMGYALISSAAQFDPKMAAQEIYAGKSIEQVENSLNDKWRRALEATR